MYVCMSGPVGKRREGKGRDAMSVPWDTCREGLGMSEQQEEEEEESEASCPWRMED